MDTDKILEAARSAVTAAADERALDEVRVAYLGKKGELTALLKGLGKLDPEERPKMGALINVAKQQGGAYTVQTPWFKSHLGKHWNASGRGVEPVWKPNPEDFTYEAEE